MKPNQSETNELLKKLAKSASWWRRFFESSDAEEIHQIISELSPLDLATLDQRVRESWTTYRYYNLQNWQSLRPSDVGRLAQSKFATSLVGLASFHFSGYVEPTREDFQRISVTVSQFEPYLPRGFAAELRSCLKIYFK